MLLVLVGALGLGVVMATVAVRLRVKNENASLGRQ